MARLGILRIAGAILALAVLLCFAPRTAMGCATLSDGPAYEAPNIFVTAEQAVIIWDEANKTEHFIRQASFTTDSPDIGFLVPTPDTPELAEANPQLFQMASLVGQPNKIAPTNFQSPWTLISPAVTSSLLHLDRLNPNVLMSGLGDLESQQTKSVVVGEHDVAGYRATILAAEDEKALAAWLTENGYFLTPEVKGWLQQYVDRKWKITAFKLIKTDNTQVLITRPIRLSFRTERPFYPYSEPSDRQLASSASPSGRALRVYILSDRRMTGTLADQTPWPGRIEYAGSPTPNLLPGQRWSATDWLKLGALADGKHDVELPTVLTSFIDESNPRPGTADLYLTADPNRNSFRGQAVDFTLPPQNRIVFGGSLVDFASILALIFLPTIPVYCGWKVLKMRPDAELIPPKTRFVPSSFHLPPSAPPWLLTIDRIAGALAIMLGVFYGLQFFMILLGEIVSALLGWSHIGGGWTWEFIGLLAALPVAAILSWSVIFCGVNVWRDRSTGTTMRSSNPFYLGGAWHAFMATCSYAVGSIALLSLMILIVPEL